MPDHSRVILTQLAQRYREQQAADGSPGTDEFDLGFSSSEPDISLITSRVETLRFDGASLTAAARDNTDQYTRNKITENSLLTALVWQTYARALSPDVDQLELACPVDFRRISPELSRSFFGNASAPAVLHLEREQVVKESATRLAAMIFDTIRACDERTFARYCAAVDELRRTRGLDATDRTALIDPRSGLIVTNVARFPLPPIDFGTGPFNEEFTPTNYAGTAVIVSGEASTVKVRLSYPERKPPILKQT
jgi:Transferase family